MSYTHQHIGWSRDKTRLVCACGGSSEPLVGNPAIVSQEMHEFITAHENCGQVAA